MKNLLVIGVIVLFLGVVIAPSINASDNGILAKSVVNTAIEEVKNSSNISYPKLYALIKWLLEDVRAEQISRSYIAAFYLYWYNFRFLGSMFVVRMVFLTILLGIQLVFWRTLSDVFGWNWFF
jgi:hypothetical protein